MFTYISALWKRREQETFDSFDTFSEPTGEQLLYRMKYKAADATENLQKNLIHLRKQIKRYGSEILIAKQELRHTQRAKKPFFDQVIMAQDVDTLAKEQRSRFLAYGYLRKMPYYLIEGSSRWRNKHPDRAEPNWDRIANLIFRYGNYDELLLTTEELEKAKKEQLDLLRKWVGN